MILADLIFALGAALFITVVFAVLSRKSRSLRQVLIFFLIVFFAAWAGGIWITPVGPTFLGVYWISFFVAGLIFALVLEVLASFSSRFPRALEKEIRQEEESVELIIGISFLILCLAFGIVIILGYLHHRH